MKSQIFKLIDSGKEYRIEGKPTIDVEEGIRYVKDVKVEKAFIDNKKVLKSEIPAWILETLIDKMYILKNWM